MNEQDVAVEIWKDVYGIDTHQVSNTGKIRSKDRSHLTRNKWGDFERKVKGKEISVHYRVKDGKKRYATVSVNDQTYLLHRLIAMTFLGPPPSPKHQTNHKDGDKHNNNISNLEWVTASQNELHSYSKLNKQVWNKGIEYRNEKGWNTRHKNHLVVCREILSLREQGMTIGEMATKFNLSTRQIYADIKMARKEGCINE